LISFSSGQIQNIVRTITWSSWSSGRAPLKPDQFRTEKNSPLQQFWVIRDFFYRPRAQVQQIHLASTPFADKQEFSTRHAPDTGFFASGDKHLCMRRDFAILLQT